MGSIDVLIIAALIVLLGLILFLLRKKKSAAMIVILILIGVSLLVVGLQEVKAGSYSFIGTSVSFNAYHTSLAPTSFTQGSRSSVNLGSRVETIYGAGDNWTDSICWNAPTQDFGAGVNTIISFVKQEIYLDGRYIITKDTAIDALSRWPGYAVSYNIGISVSGIGTGSRS